MRGYIKRLLLLALAGAIFLSCVYGVVAYRYWNNPPKITRNYAAELNAPVLAVPESQKAWPIYREALFTLAKDQPRHWFEHMHEFERILHVKAVADYLDRQEATLRRIREAAKLPSFGYLLANQVSIEDRRLRGRFMPRHEGYSPPESPVIPPSENPSLLTVLLTAANETQELSYALAAHAVLCGRRGETEAAIEDISAMIGIARQIREIPLLVNDLIANRRFSEAMRTWGILLQTDFEKFSNEQILRVDREILSYCNGKISVRISGERMIFADLVQRLFSDDGQGDGNAFSPNFHDALGGGRLEFFDTLTAPLAQGRRWSRRCNVEEAERLFVMIEKELERPYWECDCDAYRREIDRDAQDRCLGLVNLMLPALGNVHMSQQSIVQQRDAILAASALVRYQHDRGKWPDTLEALIPTHLVVLPPDQFTGRPLGYRLDDDAAPCIYSAGLDRFDDGGVAAIVQEQGKPTTAVGPWYWSFGREHHGAVGDLILWPVRPEPTPLDPEPEPLNE